MSAHRVPIAVYEAKLREAAPHTVNEPCTCDGSCKKPSCHGYYIGCDCDINYSQLKLVQMMDPF